LNKVVITNDIDKFLESIEGEIFRRDELKIEDVREIEKLAYISEKEKKIIVIAAEKFNTYSQNALLKLIEEPPENVEFLLVTNSKHTLLDTILSRVFVEKVNFENDSHFKLEKITNEYILELLKEDLEKNDIKALLKEIVRSKDLNETQMNILSNAFKMLELNIDKKAIISLVMLSLKVDDESL